MATTLLTIRDRVRELIDDPDDILMTDAALNTEINYSGRVWHSVVLNALPHLLETTQTLTPVGGSGTFALTSDHYATLGVRYVDDNGESYPLRRIQYQERYLYDESNETNRSVAYYLWEENIELVPVPALGSNAYTHDYVKTWTLLSSDADKVLGLDNQALDQWTEWIVYDVAAKARLKEGTDHTVFERKRDEVEQRLLATRGDRHSMQPGRVMDVRARSRGRFTRDPDFWGNR